MLRLSYHILSNLACLHEQSKTGFFLEGRLFFSQSELFENFSDCSDWLDKSRPSKKDTFQKTFQIALIG